MKYSILGFSQERAVSVRKIVKLRNGMQKVLSLDVVDLLILRDMSDFMNRKNVIKYMFDDKTFFSVSYSAIIEDLPILDIKKQALRDRLDKMCKLNLIEKKIVRNTSGNWSAFRLSDGYEEIMYSKESKSLFDVDLCSELHNGVYHTTQGSVVNYTTEDSSTITNTEKENTEVFSKKKEVKRINYDGIFDSWNKYNGKAFGGVAKRTTRRKDKIRIALTNQQITDEELMLFFSTLPYADRWLYKHDGDHANWRPDFDWWIVDTRGWLAKGLEGKVHKEHPEMFEQIMHRKISNRANEYMPHGRGIYYDKDNCIYMSVEPFYGDVYDGYNGDDRPDKARLLLNNGRGIIVWDAKAKIWKSESQ